MRNLNCKRIEYDEIWSFVGVKQKNVPEELQGQFGYGECTPGHQLTLIQS
jgi:hypothetical protein